MRTAPRRTLDEEEHDGDKLYFPPELVPLVRHPLVSCHGETFMRRVLLHRLYLYLHFTAELETLVVNPVTQLLARKRLGFDLPDGMIRDAHNIVTDEAWHAQFSDDLARQLATATGDAPKHLAAPEFLNILDRLKATEDSDTRGLTQVFFVVVSETLISAILTDIPHDRRVITAVRETIADHAQDEGRHHAFYSQFFDLAWHQLGQRQRAMIGPKLPEFIKAFLAPDLAALAQILRLGEFNEDDVHGILAEVHPPVGVERNVRAAAQPTMRLFHRNQVLDDPRIYEAFARHGLAG